MKTQPYCRFVVLFFLLLLVRNALMAENAPTPFSYKEHWEIVAQFNKDARPESALKEVEVLLKQAESEKNTLQFIKASVEAMVCTLKIEPDKAPQQISNFEALIGKTPDASNKALLQSMTAELYLMYYKNNAYYINKRTEVFGPNTGNLELWTKNTFSDTIQSLLTSSLKPSEKLQETVIGPYRVLLENGPNKRIQPTLYEFLAKRTIDLLMDLKNVKQESDFDASPEFLFLPANLFTSAEVDSTTGSTIDREIIRTYQQWLRFRLNGTQPIVLLRTDFSRIETFEELLEGRNQYQSDVDNGLNSSEAAYLQALETLASKFDKTAEVLSVIAAEATFYKDKHDANDSIRKYFLRKAYERCADGIARFPRSSEVKVLKNLQDQIRQKRMYLSNNQVVKPHTTLEVMLHASNIEKVELKIYKVNTSAIDYYRNISNEWKSVSPVSALLEKRWIKLNQDSDFNLLKTVIPIKTRGYGIYEFTLGTNENPNDLLLGRFVVSDMAYMAQNATKTAFYVVDRVSGKPVSNVRINAFTTKWKQTKKELVPLFQEGRTDQNGLLEFLPPKNTYNNAVLFFEKGADKYLSSIHQMFRYNYGQNEYKGMNLKMFTDRSLYRPGQRVYFKGIAYFFSTDRQEVAVNETIEVKLLDANRKQVAIKTMQTNEFGSFADSFVLPEDGLNGTFTLMANNSYTSFWVEAYKRPTFEVTLERPKMELRFGQTVRMQGKVMAYAGFPVSKATVEYKVMRQSHFRMLGQRTQTVVSNGTAQTSAEGTFDISFLAKRDNELIGEQYYTYYISASVTDQKGETQQGSNDISVGDRTLFISSKFSDLQLLDRTKEVAMDVQLTTLNNASVDGCIGYELFRTEQSNEYLDQNEDEVLQEGRSTLVRSGSFQTKEGKLKLDVSTETPGLYRIGFYALDSQHDKVRLSNSFVLYDPKAKRPPVKIRTWLMAPKTVCSVGENAIIKFGSSSKDVHVLCQVMMVDSVLESRWLTVSNEIRTLEMPFKSSYGDRVDVLFTFVKDEKLFNSWISLVRKQEKRTLNPKLTVFRDKLQPGEKAEWTVQIPETLDKKRQAELMVGMYDASLDAIHPHSWHFEPIIPTYIAVAPLTSTIDQRFDRSFQEKLPDYSSNAKSYCKVDWMGLEFSNLNTIRGMNVSVARVQGTSLMALEDHKGVIEEKPIMTGRVGGLLQEVVVTQKLKQENPMVSIRENFTETAFFYPQLRTDEQGNVRFSFTAPESLTRWNVKMLAHSKDLYYGRADTSMVTQKDLMVQLNLPRFVRRSDQLVLRASVVNLTDDVQRTNVRLELINPENFGAIAFKDSLIRTVELAARETKFVEWTLTEFAPYELVVCKVVASSESFSDGEQRYLPVLPDQVLITESLPMTVRANQSKTFTMDNLLQHGAQVNSQSMTVEFSPNPTWYAVQALPSLSVPENPNAFDYFTAYYVNSLATNIANSNPKLAAVFDEWRLSGNKDALRSNLEKNKELKSMLLEETPWVMAAQDESQQKKQIALLFDLNQQNQQNTQYWDKLLKLQMTSGGFAWFEGLPENRYLTQYILLNNARLNALLKQDAQPVDKALLKAISFIDNELAYDFDKLKRANPSYKDGMNIGDMQWFYLHVRSEYPQVPIPDFAQEAVAYYTTQAQTYWQEASLYGKAATALIASRNKNQKLADEILTSLKENAVKSDEMGMYWARNKPGYFWNQRPVMVQTMLLEAFAELGKNPADLDEMKMWLLRQKQTQRWDSPLSTVDAIYALLHYGSDWIASQNAASIQLGSKSIQAEQKEAGTGYFKQTIAGKDVVPSMGRASVTLKGTAGFGWGALYWQYYQNQSEVKQSGNALTVSKKLFVEQVLPSGKALIPINQVVLKKGDKVVTRLMVTVDRDLEYVALKDLRAACLEPVVQRSGCVWREGVTYYQTIKDASTQFFFSTLPKGSYVFEYETWVNNAGVFTSGITTLQCQYAPEFSAHSSGETIVVSEK